MGGPGFTLTLNGASFVNNSQATFNGAAVATPFVSSSRLTAQIPPSFISATGSYNVTVVNGAPGGGTSADRTFTVANPRAMLASIAPSTAPAGVPTVTLILTGSAFLRGAHASFNGQDLLTTFVSATELAAVVPASLLRHGRPVRRGRLESVAGDRAERAPGLHGHQSTA